MAGRPKLSPEEIHDRSFRVRLMDADANLVMALAKKADVPPAVFLRALIRQQLPAYAALRASKLSVTEAA